MVCSKRRLAWSSALQSFKMLRLRVPTVFLSTATSNLQVELHSQSEASCLV